MENWITLAPLHNFWTKPSQLPLYFNDRLSIQPLPRLLIEEDSNDPLRDEMRSSLHDVTHCILVEYEAPTFDATQPKAMQDAFRLLFALWLARRTPLYITNAAHIRLEDGGYVTRELLRYDPIRPLQTYSCSEHQQADFSIAEGLNKALTTRSPGGTIYTASQAVMRALSEREWIYRFLVLWIAIEALFGADTEITFRLSQRAGLFLGSDSKEARELFNQIKKSYGWRSKVVHGLRLAKLDSVQADQLMEETEILVQRAFTKILADSAMLDVFDGRGREAYLDELAFR